MVLCRLPDCKSGRPQNNEGLPHKWTGGEKTLSYTGRMNMRIDSQDFRVRPGEKVKLRDRPTSVKPVCKSKRECRKLLEEHVAELSSLQRLCYASNRYALLLILQGMDAAGKDGAIRHVMSGVNPEGCQVSSFK